MLVMSFVSRTTISVVSSRNGLPSSSLTDTSDLTSLSKDLCIQFGRDAAFELYCHVAPEPSQTRQSLL